MLTVSELFIYPVKSLGGISVLSAKITDRGFEHDRRWMLVDLNNRFLTQRELPAMALLQVEVTSDGLKVFHKKDSSKVVNITFGIHAKEKVTVEIFDEYCEAVFVNKDVDAWFSQMLQKDCRLVYMLDDILKPVDNKYAANNEVTSFSDGYPFLLLGQSSLDDLNKKLTEPLPVNRFRPNIVFTGSAPYTEDDMEEFSINGITFYGVKLCARCIITTINQDDSFKSKEPLKTLASYREKNNKVYFGQNLLHRGEGIIHVGDTIQVIKNKSSSFFPAS